MDRLMLLDGNGLIYRGYFALIEQPLTTSKGELVSAVFGFTNIVLRAFQDVGPDHVAVAFDLPAPTFRHEQFAEYKATRTRMPDEMREQIPKVRRVVEALGIPNYEMAGYEADDVIATLVGARGGAGPRDDDPHRRPRHAPARVRADEAPRFTAWRDLEHGRLRPGQDRRAMGPSSRTRCSTTRP